MGYYVSAESAGGIVGGTCVYYKGPGSYPKTYTGYCSVLVYATSTVDVVAATTTIAPPDAASTTEVYITMTQTNLVTSTSTYVEMLDASKKVREEKREFMQNSTWTEAEPFLGFLEKRQNVQPPTGNFVEYSDCDSSQSVDCSYGCCKYSSMGKTGAQDMLTFIVVKR